MQEKLFGLNWGQYILYGYLCNSLEGQRGSNELTGETLENIIDAVIEFTSIPHYNGQHEECPDFLIMVRPQDSFKIFCDWYDENEEYFVTL